MWQKSYIGRSCKMLLLNFFFLINCFWIYAILVQSFLCLALTQFLMEIKITCTFKSWMIHSLCSCWSVLDFIHLKSNSYSNVQQSPSNESDRTAKLLRKSQEAKKLLCLYLLELNCILKQTKNCLILYVTKLWRNFSKGIVNFHLQYGLRSQDWMHL